MSLYFCVQLFEIKSRLSISVILVELLIIIVSTLFVRNTLIFDECTAPANFLKLIVLLNF